MHRSIAVAARNKHWRAVAATTYSAAAAVNGMGSKVTAGAFCCYVGGIRFLPQPATDDPHLRRRIIRAPA